MPSQMASSTDHGSLVMSSNLTSTMKTLFKEKWISSCQESDGSLSLGWLSFAKRFLKKNDKAEPTQREWFIRFLTWRNSIFFKKRFHGEREIRTHDHRPMVCRRRHLWRHLVRWATGKRLTNRLPKLSLITVVRVVVDFANWEWDGISWPEAETWLISRKSWEVDWVLVVAFVVSRRSWI